MPEFQERGAEIAAVSTDSKFSHKAWLQSPRKQGGVQGCKYPLLADFTKKVATEYGVLIEASGIALRGLFLIDPDGVVQHLQINNLAIGRNVDDVLRLIDAYQENKKNGTVCPIGWKKGSEAITPAKAADWFAKNAK